MWFPITCFMLTRVIYIIVILKKQKKPISFQLKEIGFFALLLKDFRRCMSHGVLSSLLRVEKFM